ncbi:T3SS effector NleG family protein [Escherichia albertii]|uniref:T3SS effector NleG family protein n=1 Tax=Escherichia albertii TaxID=208962 RepID=UPI0007444AB6|nr:T3SS effector NleG family protein [Escherichia albertii]EHG7531402.1 DUF1076 domain-containing protein [Escherichia albertii]MCV3267848.1 DUF1076 domain-containing protein [Escherichia albertii]MCZ8919577.1 T3SS effector NleG family protein [Escherichia albertii]HCS7460411.1 T3SS effector NleG family protein [Escherichia albertii]HEB1071763.1 T3SS effector NleG family protein [Escherichia albertii]
MPLTSDINSSSFSLAVEALRAQVAANGRGEFTLSNETVSIVFRQTDGRFLASGGTGGLFTELLLLGLNSGPQALGERLISMITQLQESLQEKISQCKFSVCPDSLQCPPEAAQCPITLEQPEEGILVKNSEDSAVCCLFDANAFERLVREDLPHPLTREEITESMIVKPEECTYDHVRKNFVIKDN